MSPHYVEATFEKDGRLTLEDLPFHAGDSVEIIILVRRQGQNGGKSYPLRGKPIKYVQPTEPVAKDEWDSFQ